MNDGTFPGGQPYTPPRELTEEELEQVRQYLEEIPCRECGKETMHTLGGQPLCPQCAEDITGVTAKIEENAEKINEVKSLFEACVEESRFLLEESDMLEVDRLEILRQISEMSALQGRLRDLCRDRTKLLSWEEEVTG